MLAEGLMTLSPRSTLTASPFLTLARVSGGKCNFIDPSAVFTSTQPRLASTFVTWPSTVCRLISPTAAALVAGLVSAVDLGVCAEAAEIPMNAMAVNMVNPRAIFLIVSSMGTTVSGLPVSAPGRTVDVLRAAPGPLALEMTRVLCRARGDTHHNPALSQPAVVHPGSV